MDVVVSVSAQTVENRSFRESMVLQTTQLLWGRKGPSFVPLYHTWNHTSAIIPHSKTSKLLCMPARSGMGGPFVYISWPERGVQEYSARSTTIRRFSPCGSKHLHRVPQAQAGVLDEAGHRDVDCAATGGEGGGRAVRQLNCKLQQRTPVRGRPCGERGNLKDAQWGADDKRSQQWVALAVL